MNYINSEEILNFYDQIFLDIYGVLHNGTETFSGVIPFLNNAKNKRISITLVSNAPRSSDDPILFEKLNSLGINENLYSKIITSGDVFIDSISKIDKNQKIFILGNENRDFGIINKVKSFGFSFVENVEHCDAIFAVNLPENEEIFKKILNSLEILKNNNVTVHNLNPDIYVSNKGKKIYVTGYFASEYEKIGGKVIQYGKPFEEIFLKVSKLIKTNEKTIFIGDSINTDIIGVNKYLKNTDSCLILTGNSNLKTVQMLKNEIEMPKFIMNRF